MASNEFLIKTIAYRPCYVKGEKALFHQWAHVAHVRDAIMTYQTPGQLSNVFGIVEFEDGTVKEVYPYEIQFCDSPHREYQWDALQKEEKQ